MSHVHTSEAARTAMRKCAMRKPGEGVTLTDAEVKGMIDWLTMLGRADVIDHIEEAQQLYDKIGEELQGQR